MHFQNFFEIFSLVLMLQVIPSGNQKKFRLISDHTLMKNDKPPIVLSYFPFTSGIRKDPSISGPG